MQKVSDDVQLLTDQLNTLKPVSVSELNEMQQQLGSTNVDVKKLSDNLEDQSKVVETTLEALKELLK